MDKTDPPLRTEIGDATPYQPFHRQDRQRQRWQQRDAETARARTDQSFLVPKAEIVENDYDLSINRYKEIEYEEVKYDDPKVILGKLRTLEDEIRTDLDALEEMLG